MSDFLKDMLFLYPVNTYIKNIGNDSSVTNCGVTKHVKIELSKSISNSGVNVIGVFNNRSKFEIFFEVFKIKPNKKVKALIKKVIF